MADHPPPETTPGSVFDEAFKPYAAEIGFLLRDWNNLQESLSALFVSLFPIDQSGAILAAWHAVPNDRFQRAMLRASLKVKFDVPSATKKLTQEQYECKFFRDEILWILEKADTLGRQRDDAAHVPVAMLIAEPLKFIAHIYSGNPISQKFLGKELLAEFNIYRNKEVILRNYADRINLYLHRRKRGPLPERPQWPSSVIGA
jgi:hypothetical protein